MTSINQIINRTDGKFYYQIFTTTGLWIRPPSITTVEVILVGGGGGGGGCGQGSGTIPNTDDLPMITMGGGGGGGSAINTTISVSSNISITIGRGGNGGSGNGNLHGRGWGLYPDGSIVINGVQYPSDGWGENGGDTIFGDLVAKGGGGGGAGGKTARYYYPPRSHGTTGGSGDGHYPTYAFYRYGPGAIADPGENGGNEHLGYGYGGSGGIYINPNAIKPNPRFYYDNITMLGAGRGGVVDTQYTFANGEDALPNTGCGGGGGANWAHDTNAQGGKGGSGICIVRWWENK